MEDFTITSEMFMEFVLEFGPKVLAAIATLVIGLWIAKIIVKGSVKMLTRSNVDIALISFLKGLISILLKILVYITALGMLGVQMTSFIAILGAAGLAIGFALQGSLSNFAGGVLILFFKPFKVGDFIERGDESGTVEQIDILYTTLNTPDNQTVIIPNGDLANSPVTNYSEKEIRRAIFPVGIGYKSDMKKAREVILKVLHDDERTLPEPEPIVVLTNLGDSSLDLSVRGWTKTDDYWEYLWDNLEKIKTELDNAGIEIPFPQRDVHLNQQE